MGELELMTDEEKMEFADLSDKLQKLTADFLSKEDFDAVKEMVACSGEHSQALKERFGLNEKIFNLQTAIITAEEIGMGRAAILSILLRGCVASETEDIANIRSRFGDDVANIIHGLIKVNELYSKNPAIETENFRDLLLSFAEDMRVVLIIIADRVNLMRQIKDRGTDEERKRVAKEASQLYAPLAHKLGLYVVKSELEDLSLKYLEHDTYYMIKEKLSATKKTRDQYITNFIAPVEKKLKEAGLKFHIKGRTKSIHSIWQKMKKQKCQFENIYDLFAIRIILDSELDKEKQDCWQAYSIVTDMYQPNPKRLRDWLSIPKSNGYESLHITVMGPEGKWVEIQIRTERMDEIAERGLAAHWRYKGVRDGGSKLDEWLNDIRTALETHSTSDEQLVDQFKVDLYSDEVFVFTPKGDLFKLPKGATVLDFAFQIHTNVGCHCCGGRVNGKNVPMRTQLKSGDQVEVLTSQNQMPKRDWLTYAITTKAKSKIRQSISEQELKTATYAKETIERKFKNRKIEYDEPVMMRLIKKLGYKYVNEFYKAIYEETIDINNFIDMYVDAYKKANEIVEPGQQISAENYNINNGAEDEHLESSKDVLVIDQNVKGVEYSLAKCCNPVYGDEIFGFVTINRGIKIHRKDCPNAKHLREGLGYRFIKARWAGKGNSKYNATLRIVGNDDIGIVNNITSIISKENGIMLRSIDIKSDDGLFQGTLTVMISETRQLENLIKKLRTVKGVKNITR